MEPVERDGQLAVFREFLADAVAGRGRILLVSGAVGSGKTEFLTRCAELSHDAGARVLTATAGWAERELDMALMEQLFHSTELPAPMAARAWELALAEVAGSRAGATIRQSDARLIQETCAVLLTAARDRPLVLVLDDLQFADPASLATLLYLQRRIRSVRLLLLLAEVANHRPEHPVLHDEIGRAPGFRHLRLDPLSRAGVAELLARGLGSLAGARLAESCHALSGGNPLLVHALAEDHLTARASPNAELVPGAAYGRAVLRCVRRGDGQASRLAQGLAVLDELATPDRLARLLDLTAEDVSSALWSMTDAGLLTDGRFRHPAAGAAVVGDLPQQPLSALRAAAARLLHADGAGAAEVARFLTGTPTAVEGTDQAWAFPVLRAAALEALARNDPRHAVECLELAGAGRADDRDSAAVTAQLVAVQRLVEPAGAARHLPALRHAFDAGLLDDAEAGVLLRALVWQGNTDEAATVLAGLPVGPSQATRDWLSYAAPALLSDTHGPGALAAVVGDEPDAEAIGVAERVLQSCRIGETPLEDVLSSVLALNHADRGDRAGYWCDELLAEAVATGATTVWQAVLSDAAASVALWRGDFPATRRLARAALDLMPPASWGVAIGSPLAHLLTATTRLGRFDEAERLAREGLSPPVLRTTFGLRFLTARGELHLSAGRLRAALGDFLAVGERAAKWDVDLPVLLPWRQQAARVYARLDRRAEAAELVAEQLRLPGGRRTRGVPLRVLASVAEPSARLPLLTEAVDLMRERGEWYELALAFADLSRAYQTLGRPDQATVAARRARQLAQRCSVPDPGEDAARPDESSVLSAAERRVANLAALGHTNREISRMLHVTVSTVEQHLTRTYRKLNINRRADLPLVTAPGAMP